MFEKNLMSIQKRVVGVKLSGGYNGRGNRVKFNREGRGQEGRESGIGP